MGAMVLPKIKANGLRPVVEPDEIDIYLPRGIKALDKAGANPRGLFRIFQRFPDARLFGVEEYLYALASVVGEEAAKQTIVYAAPEGYSLSRHETALTLEGPARSLMVNETLLHYLSTGTRFRTLAARYPGETYPWIFMGARYLAKEDLAIATRALSEEGILSTIPRWADKYAGTESHAQIDMWCGLKLNDDIEKVITSETDNPFVAGTIRATVAFHLANPEVPLFVLGDFVARTIGCFETFRATRAVCDKLDIELVGGRMDVSKADLNDVPLMDVDAYGDETLKGMKPVVVARVRQKLDEAGYPDFQIVVSSGIRLDTIGVYVDAGASMVGIGEEAAYFLNKGECNFTSDASGYFVDGKLVPCSKEGRELARIMSEDALANAESGIKIAEHLERICLADYLPEGDK